MTQSKTLYRVADALGVLVPLEMNHEIDFKTNVKVLLDSYNDMNDPKFDYMDWYDEDDIELIETGME